MPRKYAANRIRQLRHERGLSMEALASAISPETSLTTIAKLETERMALSLDWIIDVSRALNVAPSDIIEEDCGFRMLPVVGEIAAGSWGEAIERSDHWIPVVGDAWSGQEFVLQLRGNSINHYADNGDYVVIDPAKAALEDGKLYAVQNEAGETTCKQFESDPQRLVPCSSDPSHQPMLIGSSPFTVIGRVTTVMRNLN
jgi:repressor LexA